MKESIQNALNNQIREELSSAYIYLAMAADFDANDLPGFAGWMKKQAQEEVGHAMKIYAFINERGGRAELQGIEKPQAKWETPLDAFKAAYDHERYITGTIEKLVRKAREEDDMATEAFLQWFVKEQVEEEASTDAVVKKLKMLGESPSGIYLLDRELGQRASH